MDETNTPSEQRPQRRLTGLMLVLTAVVALIPSCCGHCFLDGPADDSPPYFDARIYYPLVEGNRWEYAEADKEYPWLMSRSIRYTQPLLDTIIPWHTLREETYYYTGWRQTREGQRVMISTDTLFVIVETVKTYRDSSDVLVSDTSDVTTIEHIINPLRPGVTNSWASNDPFGPLGSYQWKLFQVDTSITLADTTFEHCLGTRKTFTDSKTGEVSRVEEVYYAPYIGPIIMIKDLFNFHPGDCDTTTTWHITSWDVMLDSNLVIP